MKLDLACGANCAEGFEGVDIAKVNDKVKHVWNLLSFPWPVKAESAEELRCSHYIEHIPMLFWTPPNSLKTGGGHTKAQNEAGWSFEDALTYVQVSERSVSLFLKFFDECHRILKPGGAINVLCPHGHSDRAFQDPTHTRFIVEDSWNYLDREWRRACGLEHAAYSVSCHFPIAEQKKRGTGTPEQSHALSLMPEVTKAAVVSRWLNMISDFDVVLVKDCAKVVVASAPAGEAVAATA